MITYSRGAAVRFAGSNTFDGEASSEFALVKGGASEDYITRLTGDFTTKFHVGDTVKIICAVDSDDDVVAYVTAVSALQLTLEVGKFTTGQLASASTVGIVKAINGSYPNIFDGGTMYFMSGTRPDNPSEDIGAATVLATFPAIRCTDEGWDSDDEVTRIAVPIIGTIATAGEGRWWRFVAPGSSHSGYSTTAVRLDGSLGTGTGDIRLTSVSFSQSDPVNVTARFELGYGQGL